MSAHREEQAEYRRLKAERRERLAREEEERKKRKHFLQIQKRRFVSHNDLLEMLQLPDGKIVAVSPVEGGWVITYLENGHERV